MVSETPRHGNFEDEEYHFSSETETPSAFVPLVEKKSFFERIKRRNIFVLIAIIIVIFVAYKFMDVITGGSLHRTVAKPVATVTPPVEPTFPAPVAEVALPPQPTAVEKRLNALESQHADYQAGLDKLNTQVTDIQNSLSDLNAHLSSLNEAIQAIGSQLAQQQAELAARAAAKIKATHVRVIHIVKPIYFVRAMIPGRAWLITGSGETITVSLGDELPGYGTVQVIDPNQGTITTSAGAIIGYSPGDS